MVSRNKRGKSAYHTEEFETVSCDAIMAGTSYYIFVKFHKMPNTKTERELWSSSGDDASVASSREANTPLWHGH